MVLLDVGVGLLKVSLQLNVVKEGLILSAIEDVLIRGSRVSGWGRVPRWSLRWKWSLGWGKLSRWIS